VAAASLVRNCAAKPRVHTPPPPEVIVSRPLQNEVHQDWDVAAQHESWVDPIAVALVVPLAVLGAAAGLLIAGLDNNIYTQVGLVLLVGLSAKNAILVVEFARDSRAKGKGVLEAVAEGSSLRFRPILMTSFSFIGGVLPLVLASGAGAVSRQSVGAAVFAGMLGVTILGILITPVLYVLMQDRKTVDSESEVPDPMQKANSR
jgi:hydrophobic/amphiphilic exporter-1 (mainly G- bacteria), HAE1 family